MIMENFKVMYLHSSPGINKTAKILNKIRWDQGRE
jgi:hypothetical protein